MTMQPKREEIDHRTIKLIVGVIAISLPFLTNAFAGNAIASISASYYEGGWSQSIFVGFLFAMRSSLPARPTRMTRTEMLLSKVAAAAALGVALFPVRVRQPPGTGPLHSRRFGGRDVLDPHVLLPRVLQSAPWKRATRKRRPARPCYVACGRRHPDGDRLRSPIDHFSGRALTARAARLRLLRRERRAHRLRRLVAHRQPHDPGDHAQRRALLTAA